MVTVLTKEDLMQEAFKYLNAFKRHRALSEIKLQDKMFHMLSMYKTLDKLELTLRAINKEIRGYNNQEDDEEEENAG